MSHSNDTSFTPDKVDQQIDDYLSGQHDTPTEHAAQQAILRFKRIYGVKHDDQSPSLERVWQRVLAAEVQDGTQSVATVDEPEAPLQGVLPLTESNSATEEAQTCTPSHCRFVCGSLLGIDREQLCVDYYPFISGTAYLYLFEREK